jgi:hypothetical protein
MRSLSGCRQIPQINAEVAPARKGLVASILVGAKQIAHEQFKVVVGEVLVPAHKVIVVVPPDR